MKRKLLTIIVLFLFFTTSGLFADFIHFKLGAGSYGFNLDNNLYSITKKDGKYSFTGGVTTELTLSRAFALEFGAFYKNYNGDIVFSAIQEEKVVDYTAKYKTKYISIPALLKVYFLNEETSPYLTIGVNTHFYLSSEYSFINESNLEFEAPIDEFKNSVFFMDIGIGVLLFPEKTGIEIEFHFINNFGHLFKVEEENAPNLKTSGIELYIAKRF